MELTKRVAMDTMEICIFRKDNNLNCLDCIHRKDCIEAHKIALNALRFTYVKQLEEMEEKYGGNKSTGSCRARKASEQG